MNSSNWFIDYYLDCLKLFIPYGKLNNTINSYDKIIINNLTVENNRLSAIVDGYEVLINFKKYSKIEKKLISVLKYDKQYVDMLKNRIFDKSFYDKLYLKNINVFPSTLSDLNFNCNCEKHKSLCIHVVYLLYHITKILEDNQLFLLEIKQANMTLPYYQEDNNNDIIVDEDNLFKSLPDILFSSKLYDAGTIFKNNPIPDLLEYNLYLLNNKKVQEKYNNALKLINNNLQDIEKIQLIENNQYNDIVKINYRNFTHFKVKNKFINKWLSYELNNLTINLNSNYSISELFTSNKHTLNKYKSSKMLFGFLTELSKLNQDNISQDTMFLLKLYDLSLDLIHNNAIIPELFKCNDKLIIRWIPSINNNIIKQVINNLSIECPDNLITFNKEKISVKNQVITMISIIISGLLYNIKKDKEDTLLNLFLQKPIKLNDIKNMNELIILNNNIKCLQDYSNYVINLIIDEVNDYFTLNININIDNKTIKIKDLLQTDDIILKKQFNYDFNIISNYFPDIVDLKNKNQIILKDESFVDFFNNTLPLIEKMGVNIMIPKSLKSKIQPKIKLKVEFNNKKTYLSMDQIQEFDWMISIGDETFSVDKFRQLVTKNTKLIQVSNKYIMIDEEELKELINTLNNLPTKLDIFQIFKIYLDNEINEVPLQFDSNIKDYFFNNKKVKNTKLPKALKAKLRKYQKTGYYWLLQNIKNNFGCILADDMGLGKTLQTLTLIQKLKQDRQLVNEKVLIIVPTSLIINWQHEINKFTPRLKVKVYHGSDRNRLNDDKYDICLTSYGTVRNDINIFNKITWYLTVIDEAQNIKNPNTKQTKAIKSIKSKNKIALTGTPIENRLLEYWSIFDFINPGYLNTRKNFTKEFIVPIEEHNNENILERLKKLTQPFILRRLKTDSDIIRDLPEKITNNLYCNLMPTQAALYQSVLDEYMQIIANEDSINRKGHILEMLTALKQICNHPAQYTKSKQFNINESGKMQLLIETLKIILENDEKTIIFTQYVKTGHIIKQLIEDHLNITSLYVHGSLSNKKRNELINKFQEEKSAKILILTLKTGGVGINLTAAQDVIHYDLWWNPAVEEQATDRAYRIGQTKNVMVYRFITTGTLEERINKIIDDKRKLADKTIKNTGKFITEMNDDELSQLLELN